MFSGLQIHIKTNFYIWDYLTWIAQFSKTKKEMSLKENKIANWIRLLHWLIKYGQIIPKLDIQTFNPANYDIQM